ncbi:unnamed protein product [Peniophora sp. CBMAI 1063]|nr:unnamed protein product [Peniophora sp. CBMAI 1063]
MAYMNNDRGPLVPGQTISVNKYTIQIERYLSKGGYAYVYLVRTPQPVNGTTQHVLKRIAVPNEGMLAEVKKEVDIMRILRGHPNIVNLIDAAWHRLPNGVYEIFILMEFCSGGGIIDMMNRRLRERLTEGEILQIFVDTCEGVAAMHNLRPALLHRDLKVENILQSSATLFKLCDFGSATPAASRPPASTAEIRALETDLNRHTTLQYRAPEMVDPYLRRPIDEKSDVWALGVLLYKLCYYTTPFEEHGPLAILNVQYKIPSYPVYSGQMNALIGSMLREHGAQRPSVFELLDVVHRMRGTKSRFTYNRATAPAPSSAFPHGPSHALSPPHTQTAAPVPTPSPNKGVQAREKVLEAIAPMRRGRPGGSNSRAPSPSRDDREFRAAEEASWAKMQGQGVRGHRSGLPSPSASAWGGGRDDAWATRPSGAEKAEKADRRKTFQPGAGSGFGDSFEGMLGSSSAAAAASASAALSPPATGTAALNIPGRRDGGRDAFYGLGISPNEKPPAPTLAEARRLRTGLATSSGANLLGTSPNTNPSLPPRTSPRPSPAPQLRPTPSPQPLSNWTPGRRSPQPPTSSGWKPSSSPSKQDENLSAEERFPSLEDLDRALSPPTSSLPKSSQSNSSPQLPPRPPQYLSQSPAKQPALGRLGVPKATGDGVRSEHVTGAAMRAQPDSSGSGITVSRPQIVARPSLVRRHRSSISIKPTATSPQEPLVNLSSNTITNAHIASSPSISSSSSEDASPDVLKRPPSAAEILGRPEPGTRDWLTGSDDDTQTASAIASGQAVLRGSPSKRASVLMNAPAPAFAQAMSATHDRTPTNEVSPSVEETAPANKYSWRQKLVDTPSSAAPSTSQPKPTTSSFGGARTTPTGTALASKPVASFGTGATKPLVRPKPALASKPLIPAAPVASQSTQQAEALSDNWSPVENTHDHAAGSGSSRLQRQQRSRSKSKSRARSKSKPRGAPSSGESDEGPEDAAPRRARAHGRQSSVHDLVDLWDSNPAAKNASGAGANGVESRTNVTSKPVPEETLPPPSPAKGPGSSFTRVRELAAQPSGSESTSTSNSSIPRSSRPRPQSMLLSSTPLKAPAAAEPTGLPKSLGPPPNPRANTTRRTSISDMVLKYESLNSPTAATTPTPNSASSNSKVAPPPTNASTKPTTGISKVASHGTASSILPSPSPRLGTFAVPASPMQSRSRSMGTALTSGPAQHDEPQPARPSRTGGAVGLPGLTSPGAKAPSRSMTLDTTGDDRSTTDKKPFALPQPTPQRPAASPAPFYEQREREREKEREAQRAAEPPAVSAHHGNGNGNGHGGDARSPSPDKPFQGVGRLIDQWQRKAGADGGAGAGGAARKGLPVSGRR